MVSVLQMRIFYSVTVPGVVFAHNLMSLFCEDLREALLYEWMSGTLSLIEKLTGISDFFPLFSTIITQRIFMILKQQFLLSPPA